MVEVFADVEQGSPEWHALRCGLVTASSFATVIAKGRTKGAVSLTRQKYMRRKAAEIISGQPQETYKNAAMERGNEMEPEARELYAFANSVEPQLVGFIKNGKAGASPDALIGDAGALEIKTAFGDIVIEKIEANKFPPEHKAQCQGVLWVAEREWIDLIIYWPGIPPFEVRATRDEEYIKTLEDEVDRFNDELAELVERIRRYGVSRPTPTPDEVAAREKAIAQAAARRGFLG